MADVNPLSHRYYLADIARSARPAAGAAPAPGRSPGAGAIARLLAALRPGLRPACAARPRRSPPPAGAGASLSASSASIAFCSSSLLTGFSVTCGELEDEVDHLVLEERRADLLQRLRVLLHELEELPLLPGILPRLGEERALQLLARRR